MGRDGGYGVHWDRTQTWWKLVPAYHLYLSRCQQMLRRGLFVADILYLTPEGAPNVFLPPPSAFRSGKLLDRMGYNFDGCGPKALIERASVEDGTIVFPDGMTYRLLVLPQVETMTPQLLQKIAKLIEEGATVIGSPPRKSPSLVDYPQCDHEVQELAAMVWGNEDSHVEHGLGKGKVIFDLEAKSADDANPLAQAKWIWVAEGKQHSDSLVGKWTFSRNFQVTDAQRIESAEAVMTASSSFELFMNGQSVQIAHDYKRIQRVDVTSLLLSGSNLLTVAVAIGKDRSNSPGLIGVLTIMFTDGSRNVINTDRGWSSRLMDGGSGIKVTELGNYGAAPWNLKEAAVQQRFIYPSYRMTAKVLASMGVVPDCDGGEGIRSIHRRDGEEDIYFIANRKNQTETTTCHFRIIGRQPEWWNPVTGERRELPQFEEIDGRTSVAVRLAAFESGFVLFRKPVGKAKSVGQNFPESKAVMTLPGPWEVSFDPRWGGPSRVVFSSLVDWRLRPESGIKYYSGKAIYRMKFDCAVDPMGGIDSISLGRVSNIASVRVNGRDLGVVWCDPWRVVLPSDLLQERDNRLEITVANLWINRLIGDSGLPQEQRLTWIPGNPFHPESPLQDSGLHGPVTLESVVDL